MAELKRTPLYENHVALGGRMVEFGGWEMPIQYGSILEEHKAVRERAGLFDVSHMGEIEVRGKDAGAFLDFLVTNRPSDLSPGQVLYTPMCLPCGGIVDDLLVYRMGPEKFLLVVNAGTGPKDVLWVKEQAGAFHADVTVEDISGDVAEVALQGPRAEAILSRLTDEDLAKITFFTFKDDVVVAGKKTLVSRTGYTGEDGFEIYMAPEDARGVWEELLKAGAKDGIMPTGLGSRDSLRFEACLPLYGQEISETTSPVEAALSYFVKWDKPDFLGKDVLLPMKAEGPPRRLVGLRLLERSVPRHGYPVTLAGATVGEVTSGMISPTLGEPLALALVPPDQSEIGTRLAVQIRGKDVPAEVVKRPFYRREKSK